MCSIHYFNLTKYYDWIELNCEIILFASSFPSGLLSSVGAMTCLLRWTAFLWTVNSIPCTFGMAVNERTGMSVCCPQLFVQQLKSFNSRVLILALHSILAQKYQLWSFSEIFSRQHKMQSFIYNHVLKHCITTQIGM